LFSSNGFVSQVIAVTGGINWVTASGWGTAASVATVKSSKLKFQATRGHVFRVAEWWARFHDERIAGGLERWYTFGGGFGGRRLLFLPADLSQGMLAAPVEVG